METALMEKQQAGDRWVVVVREEGDPEAGILPSTHRFTFDGPDAQEKAWRCWSAASLAGFQAEAEQVRRSPLKLAR